MFPVGASAPRSYFDEQARFEAMRNHSKNGQILQKHKDLNRACEKLIRGYEKEARYETSRLSLHQSEYAERLRALEKLEVSRAASLKAPNHHLGGSNESSKISGRKRSVLLFRIENRDGMNVYVNVANQRDPSGSARA